MKKTLLITLDFAPQVGGVATYWANLCKNLPADNLVVLAPEADSSIEFDTKQPYLIYRDELIWDNNFVWPRWLPFLFHSWKIARREKIEQIIAAQLLPGGLIALLLKFFLRISYFVSIHGMDVAWSQRIKRKKFAGKLVFKNARGIIANSQFTLGLAKSAASKLPETKQIIYPCPNDDLLHKQPLPALITDRLRLERFKNKKILLTVARLVQRKGHDKVIQSLNYLRNRYPDLIYLIVGHGAHQKELAALVEKYSLQERVFFFTDVSDKELLLFYDLADIFIMPARQLPDGDVEGFGIVYLEANFFYKPVIGGRSGGIKDAVLDGQTGLLVDPESIEEISKKISQLLDDRQMADLLGHQGARRARTEFNWAVQAKKLESIL